MGNKHIAVVSLNYAPEPVGIGKYNTEFLEYVKESGVDASIICAQPYYPAWQIFKDYNGYRYSYEERNGVFVRRCPLFVPKKVTTVTRLLHLLTFSLSSALALFFLPRKPTLIILVQPTLFCAPFVLLYSKIRSIPAVLHIQDYELDAMLGIASQKRPHTKVFYKLESFIMRRFDLVSTISFKMLEKAKQKGVNRNKLVHFPNWADTNLISPVVKPKISKKDFGFSEDDKVVLYSGNIGKKQGLESVISAAEKMSLEKDIKFLIVGEGAGKPAIVDLVESKGLKNVVFTKLVPLDQLPSLLVMANVHLVIQKSGIGDSVLPSKLTNILAAGGFCVVASEEDTELGELYSKFPGIYELIKPDSGDDLVAGIGRALESKEKSTFNRVARSYAEQYLDNQSIIPGYIDSLMRNFNWQH